MKADVIMIAGWVSLMAACRGAVLKQLTQMRQGREGCHPDYFDYRPSPVLVLLLPQNESVSKIKPKKLLRPDGDKICFGQFKGGKAT